MRQKRNSTDVANDFEKEFKMLSIMLTSRFFEHLEFILKRNRFVKMAKITMYH